MGLDPQTICSKHECEFWAAGCDSDSPMCDIQCTHPELIQEHSAKLIQNDDAYRLSDLFKTLGDPTRIRIMDALSKTELCVCDLAEMLDLSQSATSHQLRVLRSNKLVKYRRDGKLVYYSLDDNHVIELYRQGLEHIAERQ